MLLLLLSLLVPVEGWAQELPIFEDPDQELVGEGWSGFKDLRFLGNLILSLLLASVLGAVIAYHPKSKRTMDSIDEVETPKIFLMYALVGSVIGTLVLKYGLVVGLVVFGIGGLARFRSNLGSATKTGRVIFVTVIGLCSGLDMPHVAVVATAFGFILIYILDAQITYRIVVKGLAPGTVANAADIYLNILKQQGCRILSEKKEFKKSEVAFVFRAPQSMERDDLAHLFEIDVPEEVRGVVDWEVG